MNHSNHNPVNDYPVCPYHNLRYRPGDEGCALCKKETRPQEFSYQAEEERRSHPRANVPSGEHYSSRPRIASGGHGPQRGRGPQRGHGPQRGPVSPRGSAPVRARIPQRRAISSARLPSASDRLPNASGGGPSSQSSLDFAEHRIYLLVPVALLLGVALLSFVAMKKGSAGKTFGVVSASGKSVDVTNMSISDMFGKIRKERGKGDVQVIHFWATWCRACKIEMPHLEKVLQATKKKKVRYYFIATRSNKTKLISTGKRYKFVPYQITRRGKSRSIAAELRKLGASSSRSIPYTVVLDGEGEFAAQWKGARKSSYTLAQINKHISDDSEEL